MVLITVHFISAKATGKNQSFIPVVVVLKSCFLSWFCRVHTGKYELNSRTFQGLLKASPTVFKDLKLMKNTDISLKILLQKC